MQLEQCVLELRSISWASRVPQPGVDILISKTFCSQIFAAICKMISTEKILRAICILQIFGSARESAVASCNFLFLHLAFCIFLQIDAALIWNLQNINFAFCVYKEDFYWAVSIMEQNLNCDPWRAICKNSILHFASCNFLQYYQLASLQGAKTRSCILHFFANSQSRKNWVQTSIFCSLQGVFAFLVNSAKKWWYQNIHPWLQEWRLPCSAKLRR